MTAHELNQIVTELQKVSIHLAILETKLDNYTGHDDRISSIERWRAFLTGAVALVFIELQVLALIITIKGEL